MDKDARYLVCTRCRKKWNVSAEAQIKGEYIYLKNYTSKFEESLIFIDDIVFDAPLFYNVCGVVDIDDHEYEYGLSGMCRLVPENENIRGKR